MKATAAAILSLLFILMLSSCIEVFYPDEIIADEKIPVIQGTIIEGKSPEVKLTWATKYDENGISYIHDAQVWITDDKDNNEILEETAPGTYTPIDINFTGILGRSYTLHVITPDGKIYESTPERINSTAQLDSMFAAPVERTIYVRTLRGNLFPMEEKGLDIKVSLNKETDSTCYFRFQTNVLKEIIYTLNPNSSTPVTMYVWESFTLDNDFDVRFTYPSNVKQVVPGHKIAFLKFLHDSWQETERQSAPYIYGWVVSVHVFSISGNVYQYYNSITQQLNAEGHIFAPSPSQIKSNVFCVSNASDKVIGIFEAVSQIVFHKAFAWINSEEYLSKDLDSFPEDLGKGSVRSFPPYFWVTF